MWMGLLVPGSSCKCGREAPARPANGRTDVTDGSDGVMAAALRALAIARSRCWLRGMATTKAPLLRARDALRELILVRKLPVLEELQVLARAHVAHGRSPTCCVHNLRHATLMAGTKCTLMTFCE